MNSVVAVGVDLVDVDRIRHALERTPALADRVFTPAELEYSRRFVDPSERLAARWAAKEAVVKCLGGGVPGLDLSEIEVAHHEDGSPRIVLCGESAERAAARGIGQWLVSLSHTAQMAEAVVIAQSGGTADAGEAG